MGGNVWGGNILGGASGIPAKGDSVVNVSLEEITILSAFERDITVSCIAFDEAHKSWSFNGSFPIREFDTYFLLYNLALLS